MVRFTASTFIGDGSLWLYLDNQVVMQNCDSVTAELEDGGVEYIVHWFVMGSTGTPYSITISSPREAQFQLTKMIGSSGKDQGTYRFRS